MKTGKALGPSGIVVDTSSRWHGRLHDSWPRSCNHCNGKVPSDWEQSFIVCLYKGKGEGLEKGQLSWSQADRAGYENPGEDCGRPHQPVGVNRRFPVWLYPRQRHYAIFVVRQLQEKYLAANKTLPWLLYTWRRCLIEYLRMSSGGSWGNLLWRSRLCNWCRGCMQMRRAVPVLVRGTVKSLK